MEKKLEEAVEEKLMEIYDDFNIEIKPSKLYHLLLDNFYPVSPNYHEYFDSEDIENLNKVSFINFFFESIFDELNKISNVKYIPAKRGEQSRCYRKSDSSYDILVDYIHEKKERERVSSDDNKREIFANDYVWFDNDEFIKSTLTLFNIEGELIVKDFEDLQAVYIKKGEKEENLADYGLGFSQLIPLILFFHNANPRTLRSKTIIIEEPEANLHPALQSKLADFFVLVVKALPRLNIIIETHSEYLIRKLQYLVAKKEIVTEKCIIHYFNSNTKSLTEPKVKSIEILENGMLSDHFGSGFFDEVALLQVELMNLHRQNLN